MIPKERLEKIRELAMYDMPGIYAELLDELERLGCPLLVPELSQCMTRPLDIRQPSS